jgi:hypothetical protein
MTGKFDSLLEASWSMLKKVVADHQGLEVVVAILSQAVSVL